MLDYDLIKKMNSKNISIDVEITRERLKKIWSNITREQIRKIIKIGGFSNSRSFNKTRKTGIISVRMTVALAVALEINPFYLSAEENKKEDYSEEKVIDFIKSKNIKLDLSEKALLKKEIEDSFQEILNEVNLAEIEALEKISKEELITLMEGLFIKEKFVNKKKRIFLIKLMLAN